MRLPTRHLREGVSRGRGRRPNRVRTGRNPPNRAMVLRAFSGGSDHRMFDGSEPKSTQGEAEYDEQQQADQSEVDIHIT